MQAVLASVIVPACNAQAFIARSVSSALGQTHTDVEVIVVSDDGTDYAVPLEQAGIRDARVRHVSTGVVRGGAHRARNVGLAAARGEVLVHFDADDVMRPHKLERLIPMAMENGAAFDNIAVIIEATGQEIDQAFANPIPARLDLTQFFTVYTPLVPVVRRDCAQPRIEGIEVAEDVVANFRLIDRLGALPVARECLCEYRILPVSLSHGADSADLFERCYTDILTMLPDIPLSRSGREIAERGMVAKRTFNRAYAAAQLVTPGLSFQEFAALFKR